MAEPQPTFAEIAEALLEEVRHDALVNELAEPFMAALPVEAPGLERTFRGLQRRQQLLAEGWRLFEAMAPREAEIRAILSKG